MSTSASLSSIGPTSSSHVNRSEEIELRLSRVPDPRRKIYRFVFLLAAIYNTLWGIGVIFFPRLGLELVGLGEAVGPVGVLFWQCIGMFVMVFAIGYFCCWQEPERYRAFILIATLGKVFGPIGFVYGWAILGVIPGQLGLTIITNDLIWWPFFIGFLFEAYRRR